MRITPVIVQARDQPIITTTAQPAAQTNAAYPCLWVEPWSYGVRSYTCNLTGFQDYESCRSIRG